MLKRVFSGSSNEPNAVMIGPLSADYQISELKAKGRQEEVQCCYKYKFNFLMLADQDTKIVISSNSRRSSFEGISSGLESHDSDEVPKKYESFKDFDTVVDFSDHLYEKKNSSMMQRP
ncbi:uncharacterized protein [Rutidosis leptorrhynchoides]|uniref:uncharacterized protein isoform X2 n=1 Tax=Rutidosis leptorrhynchoides TaxID=125765 RepID=UPI003A99BF80